MQQKSINSSLLTLVVSGFFTIILNLNIWRIYFSYNTIDNIGAIFQLSCFFMFIFLVIYSLFSLFNFRYVQKFIYILFLLSSAPALYYSFKFGVLFDESMIRSLLETDPQEAFDLITIPSLVVFVLVGIIPSFLIWKLSVNYKPYWKRFIFNSSQTVAALLLGLVCLYPFYANLSSFVRNNNVQLTNSFLPYAPIHSLYVNLKANFKERDIVKEVMDSHAHVVREFQAQNRKPLALIVIIGETAREKSFSHQGRFDEFIVDSLFRRNNLIYFKNFWSCGTNTAASLPCMFSTYSKEDFSRDYNKKYENVAEIIKRVGYDVVWRDNNSGCKGICIGLDNKEANLNSSQTYYHDGEYYDEVLVNDLSLEISKSNSDQVIFLHQMGSHGPAYFKRVPPRYRTFLPACDNEDFSHCDNHQIENAYDNTVFYTKHVINRAIDELELLSDDYDTVLVYLSDHGESTGEDGYYLHGLPYFMAPEEQTHIPAMIWMSDSYISSRNISMPCMVARQDSLFSHDNFSHTLLDILEIETTVYSSNMSLLNHCSHPSEISNPITSLSPDELG